MSTFLNWWNEEKLESLIALDTETEIITHPSHIPKLVISSAYDGRSSYIIKNDELSKFLMVNNHASFVMHNALFDLAVISKYLQNKSIYLLAETDKLWDTRILYQLVKLAKTGISPQKNSLALVAKECLGLDLDKNTEVRCSFGDFLSEDGSVRYAEIPNKQLEYALTDAIVTFDIFKKLETEVSSIEQKFGIQDTGLSHKIQLLGSIALDDINKNGIGFNLAGKELRLEALQAEISEHKVLLANRGWERGKKGIKKIFANIAKDEDLDLPLTASGQISSAADTLAGFAHKSPFIQSYIKFHELEKLGTFVRNIETDRLYPKYNLLMNTGRTSSFGPNIQQLPRSGGVRELFIPAEGYLFLDIDYSALELCTLAQHLYREYGDMEMMNSINAGKDLHVVTAAKINNIPENEVTKEMRQFAKIANFGFPANMSPGTFVDYCKGYDVKMTEDQSIELKKAWTATIPSIRRFWQVGNNTTNVLITGRVRSDCTYTAYLNTFFQGIAADGAKLALYLLWKHGFKVVAFIHDQVIIEVPENEASELLPKAEALMIEGMKFVVPDVKISVEGKITDRFTK